MVASTEIGPGSVPGCAPRRALLSCSGPVCGAHISRRCRLYCPRFSLELVGWVAAGPKGFRRGKSGLQRAGCWLTASRGDSKESATENKPPSVSAGGKGETVR